MKRIGLRGTVCGLLLAAVMHLAGTPGWAVETSAIEVKVVVKVSDRAQAAEALVQSAARLDGYFTQKTGDGIVLRIPVSGLKPLLAEADQLGQVIDRQLSREDLGDELLRKNAVLKAKTEAQHQYLALLDQSDTEGALSVEKELILLVAEIETLKGQLRHLQDRIALARVEVRFEYRDRSAPVPDGSSSFAWLNTMNLIDLLEEF
jgi:hypothetical protein